MDLGRRMVSSDTVVFWFNVTGFPAPQGSKRHLGNGVLVESSSKVKPWRADVKAAAELAIDHPRLAPWRTLTEPTHVTVMFRFRRPKSHYRTGRNAHLLRGNAPTHPTSRAFGDIDKLTRSTLDALVAAAVLADDSLIYSLVANKRWCVPDEPPGATILINSTGTNT